MIDRSDELLEKRLTEEKNNKPSPILNIPPAILVIVAICIAAFIVPEYFFSSSLYERYYTNFSFIGPFFYNAFNRFWYTSITYSFLHAGVMHIAVNMLWLIIFGSPLVNRIGNLSFIVFWCVCSITAAISHFSVYPESYVPMIGASGAISGMMGAAARYGFRRVDLPSQDSRPEFAGPILTIKQSLASRSVLVFIGSWLIINIITGLASTSTMGETSSIAWEAHIGGLAAGFFLIGLFDSQNRKKT